MNLTTESELIRKDCLGNSYSNLTNHTTLRSRNEGLARVEVILQAVILTLNLIGNGAVLGMLACMSRRKRLSRMYTMIGHLSCADLCVAAFNILPQMIWDVTYRFRGGRVICKLIKYLQVTAIYAPSYVLVSTVVDRYIAICHPMTGHTWSSTTAHRLVLYSWILALLFSLPQLIIFDYVEVTPGVYDCWEHFNPAWTLPLYIVCFTVAVYIIPLFILAAIYSKICLVVWRSSSEKLLPIHNRINLPRELDHIKSASFDQNINPDQTSICSLEQKNVCGDCISSRKTGFELKCVNNLLYSSNCISSKGILGRRRGRKGAEMSGGSIDSNMTSNASSSYRVRVKTIKLTLTVVVSYLLCWGPFFFSQMWYAWDPNSEESREGTALVITLLLASLNSCTNPWIYLGFSDQLRRRLLSCCSVTKGRNQTSTSTGSNTTRPSDTNRVIRTQTSTLDSKNESSLRSM